MRWTYFNVETGRISKVETRPASNPPILKDGVDVVEGHFDEHLKWIDNGEVKDRPELDLPDHIVVNLSDNEVELPDIPEDTVVRYDGMEAGVADEEGITLSFDEAGKWEIYFDPPFPYQPAIIEAEVEDD